MAAGDQWKAPAKGPEETGAHRPAGQSGSTIADGAQQKTKSGTSSPAARAAADHDPEGVDPERQERAGAMPGGHVETTHDVIRAAGPVAATARTRAVERAA